MNPFTYLRPADELDAMHQGLAEGSKYLGGGTNLVDLMREKIERPAMLVDVSGLSSTISATTNGGLLIGAAARNTAVAEHPAIRFRYPMLTRAIRGLSADSQHGDGWRKRPSANTLCLLLR